MPIVICFKFKDSDASYKLNSGTQIALIINFTTAFITAVLSMNPFFFVYFLDLSQTINYFLFVNAKSAL